MKLRAIFSAICMLLVFSCVGQINFSDLSWEELKEKAKTENKNIFIDVYTTWCGPCKKLSKTTFQDKDFGNRMNAEFVSMKWDAESDAHKSLAKKYEVNSYPTLLFFNPRGELLKKAAGFKTAEALTVEVDAFISFSKNQELQKNITNYTSLNQEETRLLLEKLIGLKTDHKNAIFDQFIEGIGDDKVKWAENLDIILDNFSERHSISFLEKVVAAFTEKNPSMFSSNMEQMKKTMSDKQTIQRNITLRMRKAKKEADFTKYQTLAQLKDGFNHNTKTSFASNNRSKEQYDNDILNYYAHNVMKKEYAVLGEKIINTYVLTNNVEKVRSSDKAMNAMMEKMSKNDPDLFKGIEFSPYEEWMLKNNTASLLAGTLYDISHNYAKMFGDDKKKLSIAEEWSLKGLEYLELPALYYNLAFIYHKQGKKKKAKKYITKAKEAKYLTDDVTEDLKELEKSF